MSVYDFTVEDQNGNSVSLNQYRGKVLLVINSATGCGFTPQYKDLESLYEKYKNQGFEILDFPCDQFGHQAPGSDDEIHEFCVLKFGTDFPQFHKIEVNGDNADPLFTYLTSTLGFTGFGKTSGLKVLPMKAKYKMEDPNYETNPRIKWNFTKFLINRDGNPVQRFEPIEDVEYIEEAVKELL